MHNRLPQQQSSNHKDQDQDQDLALKDEDHDFSDKDQDKVKDLTFKDEDKDKDFKFVLKDSLRTRTNITDCMVSLLKTRYWTIRKSTTSIYEEAAWT